MSQIWRFYSDADRSWRWQLLAFDHTVLEASVGGYQDYERCVSNAEEHGYRYSPAKSTRPAPGRKLKFTRRYAKVPAVGKEEDAKADAAGTPPGDEAPEYE